MEKNIITISREFGSGGRTIGRLVAQKLGYDFYDGELVKKVAEETGFDEKYIEQEGEYAQVKSWLAYAFSVRGVDAVTGGMSNDDYLWATQYKVIREIAEKGNCVIVGRCADYILRDHDNCLNVYVHADMKARAERIVKKYGEKTASPRKRLEEKDKRRKLHYKRYTGQDWGVSQNYHLCLDSSVLGIGRCVDMIIEAHEDHPDEIDWEA